MLENFLPLRRELRTHWTYTDSQFLHLWIEMLYSARYSTEPKTEVFKGVMYTINRGEFIFSRSSYSQRLNIPESRIRKAVDLLIKDNMIEIVSSLGKNKPTIYKIINYDLYNNSPSETVGTQGVQEFLTQSQPSRNPVVTQSQPLKKKENNANKEKENKYTDEFIEWWNLYPKKNDKEPAFNSYVKARKKVSADDLLKGLNGYLEDIKENNTEKKYIKNGSTFLNKKSYVDYLSGEEEKPVMSEALLKALRSRKRDLEKETEGGIESFKAFGQEPYYNGCIEELRGINERLRGFEETD